MILRTPEMLVEFSGMSSENLSNLNALIHGLNALFYSYLQ